MIIETVVFLGRQNIPLRSHRDEFLGGILPCPPLCIRHWCRGDKVCRWVLGGAIMPSPENV